MASNLRVDTILPSSGTTLGIGTAGGSVTFLGDTNITTSGTLTAGSASITGNLGIGGTLTYEDVTNVDSVGVITARDGIRCTGIVTATTFHGDGSALTGVGASFGNSSVNSSGIATFSAFVPTAQGSLSHRNILINGSCAVSQRGTSFSGTGFTLDRYYVGSGDYSVAQVTDAPSNSGLTYSLRISRTASTTGYLTAQMIELPATGQAGQFYNGAKFTLSGYVKGTSGATIVPTLRFSTGTGGSNGSTFTRTEGAFTCNGSWQPFTFHFTVDENVGGSDKCVQFYFTFVTTATGQNVFLTGLQLELGEQATPFEHRSFPEELVRCQRYYAKGRTRLTFNGVSGRYNFTTVGYHNMRAAPTVTGSFATQGLGSVQGYGSDSINDLRQIYVQTTVGSGLDGQITYEATAEL